nr:dihydrofolate reductase family protein [Adhaeribacter arboris]
MLEHSEWYNKSEKVVLSHTMKGATIAKTIIISENVISEIEALKKKSGKNILIFGSPTAAHSLMAHHLIDEY